jgi:hypothetical protein
VPGIDRARRRGRQQRRVREEVGVVDEGYAGAGRDQTLKLLGRVVTAEAPTSDDDVLTDGRQATGDSGSRSSQPAGNHQDGGSAFAAEQQRGPFTANRPLSLEQSDRREGR